MPLSYNPYNCINSSQINLSNWLGQNNTEQEYLLFKSMFEQESK